MDDGGDDCDDCDNHDQVEELKTRGGEQMAENERLRTEVNTSLSSSSSLSLSLPFFLLGQKRKLLIKLLNPYI